MFLCVPRKLVSDVQWDLDPEGVEGVYLTIDNILRCRLIHTQRLLFLLMLVAV